MGMRASIYPNTVAMGSTLRRPNDESPLYRRWFSGAGQRGGGFAGIGLYSGFSGLGQLCADGSEPYQGDAGLECDDGSTPGSYIASELPTTTTPITTPITPIALIPSPTSTTLTQTPTTQAALCPDGSPPWSDGSCVTCPDGSVPWSDGSCGSTPATPNAVPVNAAAQLAAALAKALAPTPSPIAGGVPSCPAGYVYGAPGASVVLSPGVATVGTGKCLPSTAAGSSLISGVTNAQLTSYVVLGGVTLLAIVLFSSLAGG